MYNVPKGKISQLISLALPLVNFLNKNLAVLSHDNTKKKSELLRKAHRIHLQLTRLSL